MKQINLIALFIIGNVVHLFAQEFIPLWPKDKKPNFNGHIVTDSLYNERIWRVATPGIYAFPAASGLNTGTAVLICPGGGYERLSHIYNGFVVAAWFNARGINAYVLIYRLPPQSDLKDRALAPLQDVQRALKLLRFNAQKWHLQTGRIGVFGASAGGHVAGMAGTRLKDETVINDEMDTVNFKPDFMILVSPVVTMGEYAHKGSRKNLLGDHPSKEQLNLYSNELQVSASSAPAFMVHAQNDSTVPVKNSVLFYNALIDKKVNASLHVFPQGGHGIRMYDNPGSTNLFPELMILWMMENKFLVSDKK